MPSPRGKSKALDRDQLVAAYRMARRYFRRNYVTGITLGEPIRIGELHEGRMALCIHVEQKHELRYVRKDQVFPREILGVPVDVVERRHRPQDLSDAEIFARQLDPIRPLRPGVALSTEDGNFGTLGMIVFDRTDRRPCVLSAAHVLQDGTSAVVVQPGANVGGLTIGRRSRVLLDSDGDAAIARLDGSRDFDITPLGLGAPRGIQPVRQEQRLTKSGARTGVTEGVVTSIGEISVHYDNRNTIPMHGFEIRPLDPTRGQVSDKGDSGSAWLDSETGDVVGLTVGGDPFSIPGLGDFALACHIGLVCKRLQISLDPEGLVPPPS